LQQGSRLSTVCSLFNLSDFERDILILCVGMEIEGDFGQLCAAYHGAPSHAYPTFGLALATFDDVHWSALAPHSPLRYWRLIETRDATTLANAPLRVDERILHLLIGVEHALAESVAGLQPVSTNRQLTNSEQEAAERIAKLWAGNSETSPLPLIHLCGIKSTSLQPTSAYAAWLVDMNCMELHVSSLPSVASEVDGYVRMVEREMLLRNSALHFDCGDDLADQVSAAKFLGRVRGPVIVVGRLEGPVHGRPIIRTEVSKPSLAEQAALWRSHLGLDEDESVTEIRSLVGQFDLCCEDIIVAASAADAIAMGLDSEARIRTAWAVCRDQGRVPLESLAKRVSTSATWDDLILPRAQVALLHEITQHLRHRAKVYDEWGFGAASARGLGINALFWGASGTGKTMAAEVLANALQLDVFRIDLSAIVSKYIGDTEKNLRLIFDAAEESGAILLFDEADALFGKRSEVRDSHDRFANIEVGYLLQRMEAYRGLAILTTNLRDSLDPAFTRRIRFCLEFPFPDLQSRAAIWRRTFPEQMPSVGLDHGRMAQLNVSGGSIRNIAIQSAFLAAEDGVPVSMSHVLRAARSEYEKLGRPMGDNETRGWQ